MSYQFKPDETVEAAVRRIGASQLDKTIAVLEHPGDDLAGAIHQARKRCKKLRGLVRLVRPVFADYGRENRTFRDAARQLGGVRNGTALVEALEGLAKHYGEEVGEVGWLLERLKAERDEALQHLPLIDAALALLQEARARCDEWTVEEKGFKSVERGLRKTYQRARKGYRKCRRTPSPELLHDWRKRVKYHGNHVQLLGALWQPMSKGQRAGLNDLGQMLGDHHDLENLRRRLEDDALTSENGETVERLRVLIHQRMGELTEDALALGCVLLALKPKDLMVVFERWWKAAAD